MHHVPGRSADERGTLSSTVQCCPWLAATLKKLAFLNPVGSVLVLQFPGGTHIFEEKTGNTVELIIVIIFT